MRAFRLLSLIAVLSLLFGLLPVSAAATFPLANSPAATPHLVVTFPGNWVAAAGLGNDWDPGNLNTQANDANSDQVWKFTTDAIPAGSYEFKATVGGTWDENYGVNGVPGGPNVPFTTAGGETVHFYYDRRDDNMVASRPNYRIPVLVGSLMDEVGGQDWAPDNLIGWMKDRDGDDWYETEFDVPPGSYEYKIALNESWDENYGQGGVPGGPNITLVVPAAPSQLHRVVTFRYNDTTHEIQHVIADPPPPLLVTFPGNWVAAAGLGNDWDPGNLNTQANDANNDQVWKFTTDAIPAGSYEFKATVGGTWDENYGVNGVPGGPNVPFTTAGGETVHFYYDRRDDNMVASRPNYRIPVLVGSLMDEVGGQDWAPDNLIGWMKDRDGDDWYETTFDVPPGSYEYKIALNESWDENYGQGGVPGGPNITLVVPAVRGPANTTVTFRYNDVTHQIQDSINNPPTPQVGDDNIWWDGLGHDSRSGMYRDPFGAVSKGTNVTLRFRTFANDVQHVKLRVWNTALQGQTLYNLTKVATDPAAAPYGYDYWETTLDAGADLSILYYRFIIEDGSAVAYYEDDGARDGGWGQTYANSPDISWNIYVYEPGFDAPDWAKNAIIYQIFPDRFRNGSAANDPTASDWFYPQERGHRFPVIPWNTIVPDPEPNDPNANPDWYGTYSSTSYGGDLQGLIGKLAYLQNLGVTAIYLNPIFDSPSNHKYDGRSYTRIDPTMGVLGDDAATLALFEQLTAQAHNRGIRIILDGVPNHVSSDSPYFDRFGRHPEVGACEDVASPYRSWFFFQPASPPGTGVCAGDTNYTAWFGVQTLPQINTAHADVLNHWFGPNGVATYWLDRGADGWRIDVVPDVVGVNPTFFETFRTVVKTSHPDAMLFSETWGEDDARFRLLGDEFDSTMNYRFRKAMLGFMRDTVWSDNDNNGDNTINPLSPSQFDNMMRTVQEDLPAPAFESAMNLLDSHDTNRAVRVLDHDGIAGGQPVNGFQDGRNRLALLAVVQMTLPGAPTIYYGDEVGLVGFGSDIPRDDPYNRQPYPWADEPGYDTLPAWRKAHQNLLQHYRNLTALRNGHSFLRTGSWNTLLTDDAASLLVYGRRDETGVAIIAINRDAVQHQVALNVDGYVPEGAVLDDGLSPGATVNVGADRMLTFDVAGMGARVWISRPGLDMTRPAAPTGLAAVEGSGSVSLTWNAPADAVVAGYHVYRSVVDGGYEQINATLITGTAFSDDTVQNGYRYFYHVKAVTPAGLKSQASAPVAAIPHYDIGWANLQWPPDITHVISFVNRTATVYGQVWIDGVTGLSGPTPSLLAEVGYGPDGSQPGSSWTWSPMAFNVDAGNNDEFMGTMLPHPIGEYDYAVRYSTTNGRDWLYADLDGTGNGYDPAQAGSLHVVPSSDLTPPAVPLNLHEVSRSASAIAIAWDASPDADVVAYGVYREPLGVRTPNTGVLIAYVLAPETSYTDTDVTTGHTYRYTVTALDDSFNESDFSNPVDITAEQRAVQITWNLTIPAFTPPGDTIYIAGDTASVFGAQWNPSATPLTRVDDTHWTITLTGLEGMHLQYKFTRGNWETVERWGTIVGFANRHLDVVFGPGAVQTVNLDDLENWRDLLVVETGRVESRPNSPDLITSVWARMNRPVNPATVAADTITVTDSGGQAVPGVTTYDDATTTFIFTPDQPFGGAGVFTARVNPGNLRGSENDNVGMMAPYQWTIVQQPTAVALSDLRAAIPAPWLWGALTLLALTLALGGVRVWRR